MNFEAGPGHMHSNEDSDADSSKEMGPNIDSAKKLLAAIEADIESRNIDGLIDRLDDIQDKTAALKELEEVYPTDEMKSVLQQLTERETEIEEMRKTGSE